MEGQDAGDRYLGAPGSIDMDTREDGMKSQVGGGKHEGNQKPAQPAYHKDVQHPVVYVRAGRHAQAAALTAAVHAGCEIESESRIDAGETVESPITLYLSGNPPRQVASVEELLMCLET